MNIINVDVCTMYSDVCLPQYQTTGSAGCDVKAYLSQLPLGEYSTGENGMRELRLYAGQTKLIPTGLKFSVPDGYEMQIRPRSGLSAKTKLRIANSPGTLDQDYRGELMIIMENTQENTPDCEGHSPVETVKHGDRIAQLVFAPIVQAAFTKKTELDKTARAEGGFGSTGTK